MTYQQSLKDAARYVLAHFDGSEAECEDCAFLHDEQPCAEHAVLNDLRTAFVRETVEQETHPE